MINSELSIHPQEQRLYDALEKAGPKGLTSWELVHAARVLALGARLDRMRNLPPLGHGLKIDCEYEGLSDSGAKVFRYIMRPAIRQPVAGQMRLI